MYWTTKMFKQLEAQIQSFFPVSREEARGGVQQLLCLKETTGLY